MVRFYHKLKTISKDFFQASFDFQVALEEHPLYYDLHREKQGAEDGHFFELQFSERRCGDSSEEREK